MNILLIKDIHVQSVRLRTGPSMFRALHFRQTEEGGLITELFCFYHVGLMKHGCVVYILKI